MSELSRSEKLHINLIEIISDADPGQQLPSEPALAEELGVSRATLREAMRTFETQGFLRRRQGVGTFVVRPTQVIESGLEVLESIETLSDRIGLPVSMGEFQMVDCDADDVIAQKLTIEKGSKVQCISRVIVADDRPVAFLVDTIRAGLLAPDAIGANFTGSVLDLLLKRGIPVLEHSRCEINAVAATSEVARALDIQRGDSVLRFESLLYSIEGEPIDYSFSYFLPGYFKFHVVRRVGNGL
ncbi:MAG: GntR family transcriptional regulator [Anaerolineales bacterium]|nr:GntR family transcriptional regulator [Chloroflexota bacterium]MBL6981843.1 GntR family transcriptional regulator [Anaerolineales bacterium]